MSNTLYTAHHHHGQCSHPQDHVIPKIREKRVKKGSFFTSLRFIAYEIF